MPKGSRTTLFVSSTCYDLSQLRADLRDFAESVGFEPVLSEMDSFPVNPSQNAIQNCLEVVRTRADLFVLVVGGRYGSMNEAGKSITNLEYLEASARGIPKYVFVKSEILSILSIWRTNPNADFSSTVDTPKLFEFVSNLKDGGEVWIFPFTTAQDITGILRKQLSYLFSDCLALRAKLQVVDFPALQLGPDSLRIYVDKPTGWEYLVFAKILQERIRSHRNKKLDLELGISFGAVINLNDREVVQEWLNVKFTRLSQIVRNLGQAINSGIDKAVGTSGGSGDIERIEHLASRIADGYVEVIEWTLEFNRVVVEAELEKLMKLASSLSINILTETEDFSVGLYGRIQEAFDNHKSGDIASFTLKLTLPDTTAYESEIRRLQGEG